MTGAGEPPSRDGGYDAADLRGRIAVSFSARELRELAEALGAGDAAGGTDAREAARGIVRHFERSGDLATLVGKLREARPLLEWPDAGTAPAGATIEAEEADTSDGGAKASITEAAGAEATDSESVTAETAGAMIADAKSTDVKSTDPKSAATRSTGARGMEAGAMDAGAANGEVGAAGRLENDAAAPEGPGARRAWTPPGHAAPEAERGVPGERVAGVDPRILVVVSGLTLLAAMIAFAAGRASSAPPAAGGAPAVAAPAPPGAGAPLREGPAARAALHIARSLANVARACELQDPDAQGAGALRLAFDRCGPPELRPLPSFPRAAAASPAEDEPERAAGRVAARREAQAAAPARPAAPPCIEGCSAVHRTCMSGCGPEPTEGSKYAEHQACLGTCLKNESKCRLRCP